MKAIAIALALLLGLSVLPVGAADLLARYGGDPHHRQPPYYGKYEPWSRQEERPPRLGYFYLAEPIIPTVNALVPMNPALRNVKPEPWTPAWFSYCAARWPSFNPRTGTIETPDGTRMCL